MKLLEKINELTITVFFYIFAILPIKKNKVVFCNYLGKGYGCNPKYIAEEIMKRNLKWDLVWLVNDIDAEFPRGIRLVKYGYLRSIYELSTARVWIDNQRKLPYIKKRKSQYFIETWHGGGGPIKKIGADNPRNFNDKPYEATSHHMDKITDLMISNSTCCSNIYRSAFLYTGEILESGYPRNDILVNNNHSSYKVKINQYFGLEINQNTVLYAPTYRRGRGVDKYGLDEVELLNSLKKKFGGSWKLLKRLHPTMVQKASSLNYNEDIINATVYDDMQELLAGCDILISDYSCTISEFALTGKPVFLFATDINEYSCERDFYIDYNKLPFPIAQNYNKLNDNIINFNQYEYEKNVTQYLRDVGMKETGRAARLIVDRLMNEVYKN